MAVVGRRRIVSMNARAVLWSVGVLLLLCPHLCRGEDDEACNKEWYTAVSKDLVVSWTGDDRNGTVEVNVTTKDTLGRPCIKSGTFQAKFKERTLRVKNPCSNTLYNVIITLTCAGTVKRHQILQTPPEAPEVSATGVKTTNTTVEFSWKAPPGVVTNYTARVTEGSRKVAATIIKERFAKFVKLHPYTDYGLSVSAINSDEWSDWSKPVTVRTSQGVPHAPRNLKATLVKSRLIHLKWEEPLPSTGPILRYDLRWAETGEEEYRSEEVDETFFSVESLYPYTDYTISLTASTEVGSGSSANLTLKTALAVPDPPAVLYEKTNTSIFVSWELSSVYRGPDPTYSVRWKLKGSEQWAAYKDLDDPQVRNYTITGLMPFKMYEVQIRARNPAGIGLWSGIIEIETLIGIPSPPRNLRVNSTSSRDIMVQWDVPKPPNSPVQALRYVVGWSTKPQFSKMDTVVDTWYQAQSLTPFTDYEFQIQAVSSVGESDWTDVLKVKTNIGIPGKPLNLTEVETTNTSILIRWLPPERKNGPRLTYVVTWTDILNDLKDEEGIADNSSCCVEEVNITEFEIKNLYPYRNYSIEVCAKSAAGQGNCTEPMMFETMPGIPTAPSGLRLSNVRQTSLTLQWFAPDHMNGPLDVYTVHWGVMGTHGSRVQAPGAMYTAYGLRPYTDYFFDVAAKTLGGEGAYSYIHGRTAIAAPSAPRDVTFSSVTDRNFQLKWTSPEHPNAPAVQYTVKWRKNASESPTHVHETNDTTFNVKALDPSTNYSVEVCAETEVGKGPWTEAVYVQTQNKDRSSAIIAGSVVGVLLLLLVAAGLILMHLARKRGGLRRMMTASQTTSAETLQTNISMAQLQVSEKSERLSVQNFDQHVLQLMRHGYYKLTQEFERLARESPIYPSLQARKSDNLTKNRWVKILPFDYSRVKLMSMADDVEPDYINASYLPGDSHVLEYIATQGPLANTVNDFWRMVWQHSVFLIVMLTQCVERAKRTCERYWPSPGETVLYGEIDVQAISESITPTYIARVFLITQAGKKRHVVHLHYTNWPVSGCPKSPDDFLAFVRAVRGQVTSNVTGPMLVHCSAGIGRTGTFIAVDRLSQGIARDCEELDIFGTVLEMRKNRPCVVQTEEQYYFIYLCLQRIIQESRAEKEADYGEGIYSN